MPINSRVLILVIVVALDAGAGSSLAFAGDNTNETSTWPPDAVANNARNNLRLRKDGLDAVSLKMIASPYAMVSQQMPGEISARRIDSETGVTEIPADKDIWSELLTAAGFKFVVRNNDEVHFSNVTQDSVTVDGIAYSYLYVWSKEYVTYECRTDYLEFRCGQCGERLETNWTIVFAWAPTDIGDWSEEESKQCIQGFVSAAGDSSSPSQR